MKSAARPRHIFLVRMKFCLGVRVVTETRQGCEIHRTNSVAQNKLSRAGHAWSHGTTRSELLNCVGHTGNLSFGFRCHNSVGVSAIHGDTLHAMRCGKSLGIAPEFCFCLTAGT
jgi:hypothetical protein